MVPPLWVRRLVLGPLPPVLVVLLLTSLPLTAIAAVFASRWLPGRWRPLRLLWFLLVYLVVESLALVALFGLWVASGFGRRMDREPWQAAHYALMRWYLAALVGSAQRRFDLRGNIDLDEARSADAVRRPLLVLARHAGPGDSFLLVHGLLQLGYRPRIVLRGALRWAPTVDVALHRVPSFFVVPGQSPGAGTRAIRGLAAGMEAGDALVIFPEGRNFTPERRTHSITRLEELGDHHAAEDARELRHVLMPRPGGTLAALETAPEADVMFVAHAGLEELSGLVDLWRGLPMDAAVEVKLWRVPASHIPTHRDARAAWLAWWWRRIDAWLLQHVGEEAVPDALVAEVAELAELAELAGDDVDLDVAEIAGDSEDGGVGEVGPDAVDGAVGEFAADPGGGGVAEIGADAVDGGVVDHDIERDAGETAGQVEERVDPCAGLTGGGDEDADPQEVSEPRDADA
jgi:1-acyl-sn-glycerol-3-phosphate acyltransferase